MTLTKNAKKVRAKRASRPIYTLLRLAAMLPDGEERAVLVAEHPMDRRLMKERGYRLGDQLRVEIKTSRNVKFHRLAHAVGGLMVDNVEGWEGMDSHEAIKRLQLEADVCCEMVEMDAKPVIAAVLAMVDELLGAGASKLLAAVLPAIETIPVKQAQSLAFDSMDEDEFARLFEGITAHIGKTYAHVMLDSVREEFWQMALGKDGQKRRAA